ncbi:MAG: DUF5906 domain-containing protein [Microcoleus anatoxicus]|uniref:DUF5906 domain-containing protein n=1 Tax=Microcoleus anatoxicus TaxID=2705319 RepID=UPI00366E16E6
MAFLRQIDKLKAIALSNNLTKEVVKTFGSLSKTATWLAACEAHGLLSATTAFVDGVAQEQLTIFQALETLPIENSPISAAGETTATLKTNGVIRAETIDSSSNESGDKITLSEQLEIIKREFDSIGVKVGKNVTNLEDCKVWVLSQGKDKARLYWTPSGQWEVGKLHYDKPLVGYWADWGEDYNLSQFLEDNGVTLDPDYHLEPDTLPSSPASGDEFDLRKYLLRPPIVVDLLDGEDNGFTDGRDKTEDETLVSEGGEANEGIVGSIPQERVRLAGEATPVPGLDTFINVLRNVAVPQVKESSDDWLIKRSYQMQAMNELFRGYITIAGKFYKFTDTHYQVQSETAITRLVFDWCVDYVEEVKGVPTHTRANPESIDSVIKFARKGLTRDSSEVNQGGLNCANGVVKVNSDGTHSLVPHNPNQVYTYVGGKYDPDADAADCDRLLECLEPSQREIFLRTIAASFCLNAVRANQSRIKGLLLIGDGNNGKDALRFAVSILIGSSLTGKSVGDFSAYDKGRKFPLAGLENSLVNWSSETSDDVDLSKIVSLKQFITGDPIDIEYKFVGQYQLEPKAVFIANSNYLPKMTKKSESILSRFAVLKFTKTFKKGAIASKGELEVDGRFKYDAEFMRKQVIPALLNKILLRIPLVLNEGINYDFKEVTLESHEVKTNHLTRFVEERGYRVTTGAEVSVKELFADLMAWYQEEAILEIKGKTLYWDELPYGDKPIKFSQHLSARLIEAFPQVKKSRLTVNMPGRVKGESIILGLGK